LREKGDPKLKAFHHLHHDICGLQGMLKEMDRKLDEQLSQISSMDLKIAAIDVNILSSRAKLDLVELPRGASSCNYAQMCVKAPETRVA